MATLTEVKAAQPEWFSRGNRKFFHDVSYRVLHGKTSKKPFLVRSTYAWSDMFGAPKKLHYRINNIHDSLEIGLLVDGVFEDIEQVKEWLAIH